MQRKLGWNHPSYQRENNFTVNSTSCQNGQKPNSSSSHRSDRSRRTFKPHPNYTKQENLWKRESKMWLRTINLDHGRPRLATYEGMKSSSMTKWWEQTRFTMNRVRVLQFIIIAKRRRPTFIQGESKWQTRPIRHKTHNHTQCRQVEIIHHLHQWSCRKCTEFWWFTKMLKEIWK